MTWDKSTNAVFSLEAVGALSADVEGLQCHQLRSEGQRSPEPGGHDTLVRYARAPVHVEGL